MTYRDPALQRLVDVLDDGPFDGHARWLAHLTGAPVALVTIIDGNQQRFAGMHGLLGTPAGSDRGTHVSLSLCADVVDDGRPLLVGDARRDRRLRSHPAVTTTRVRAYLGMPLRLPSGARVGSVCVADVRPRRWQRRHEVAVGHVRGLVERHLAGDGPPVAGVRVAPPGGSGARSGEE